MSRFDSLEDSMFVQRTQRSNSVQSHTSNQGEDDVHSQDSTGAEEVESQNLLAPNQNRRLEDSVTGDLIRNELKRALDPLIHSNKMLKLQVDVMDKKLTTLVQQNESLQTQLKEVKSEVSKGADDLGVLLTAEGLQCLKYMCFRNMDMHAHDQDETILFGNFMGRAKDEGWLLKQNAKSEKDLLQRYREKRNYLKAQIRFRMLEDIVNKTAYQAGKLEKTIRFVRDHIGVPELPDDCTGILYNLAYTMVKYLNKKAETTLFDEAEKAIKKNAEANVWAYVLERVTRDRTNKRNSGVIKQCFTQLLEGGLTFEPL